LKIKERNNESKGKSSVCVYITSSWRAKDIQIEKSERGCIQHLSTIASRKVALLLLEPNNCPSPVQAKVRALVCLICSLISFVFTPSMFLPSIIFDTLRRTVQGECHERILSLWNSSSNFFWLFFSKLASATLETN
jgi:hypothetical protein